MIRYINAHTLAKAAGVKSGKILRLIERGLIKPDAEIRRVNEYVPLWKESRLDALVIHIETLKTLKSYIGAQ